MAFRFSKSMRFGPMRVNLSKSGIGASVGVKGFRVGSGPRGAYTFVSLPGTGLSYRTADRGHSGRDLTRYVLVGWLAAALIIVELFAGTWAFVLIPLTVVLMMVGVKAMERQHSARPSATNDAIPLPLPPPAALTEDEILEKEKEALRAMGKNNWSSGPSGSFRIGNWRPTNTGPRGGKYQISSSGKKVYKRRP
jgi:hypothetical protein